jgi:predicted aminopeptidase
MRAEKRAVFEQLRKSYETLKHEHWSGNGWFDRWFERPLNNARLSAVATYYQQVPQLTALLQRCGSDFARFYRVLKEAAKADELDVPSGC